MYRLLVYSSLLIPNILFSIEEPDLPPLNGTETNFAQELLHMLVVLGIIVAFIMGLAWVMRRLLNQRLHTMNSGASIKVVERRGVSAKAALYLVEIHGHSILIGESPAGLQRLADFPTPSYKEHLHRMEEKE